MAMAQYLSKYLFNKYKDREMFAASQCGLSVSNSINPEPVAAMVDDANITLNSWRIICNYIRDAFGKRAILPEEEVHNSGTGYMEEEYVTYEYDKDKGTENKHINFWYRQDECLLTSRALSLTNECS